MLVRIWNILSAAGKDLEYFCGVCGVCSVCGVCGVWSTGVWETGHSNKGLEYLKLVFKGLEYFKYC